MLHSFAWVLPLSLLLTDCAALGCPSGQELGANACLCSSTLEPPVNGTCVDDGCDPDGCPCTVEGIEAAIARGGTQVIKCADRAPAVSPTKTIVIDNDVTLDGQGNLTVKGDHRHLLLHVQASVAELTGFTITDGDQGIRVSSGAALTLKNSFVANNISTASAGGGISNAGSLSLVESDVENNVATVGAGGGIFNGNTGHLTLTNSRVSNNVAEDGPGGGIRNDRGIVEVNGSEVSENNATQQVCTLISLEPPEPCANGGGISNYDGTVTVIDSVVRDNDAFRYGGGISTEGADGVVEITRSTISGNRTTNQDPDSQKMGGGIWCHDGSVESTDSTWSGNESVRSGGAFYVEGAGAVLILKSSTVSGNLAAVVGGGVRVYDNASATIVNSTIFGNKSNGGGGDGLHIQLGASVTVNSSTFANNVEDGISNISGTLTVIQSIIADKCVASATTVSMDHNIESPGNTCKLDGANDRFGVTAEQLNLADDLADNGGETETLLPSPSSIAVGYLLTGCAQVEDQRGFPRGKGGCDVGAVELQ